MLRRFAQMLLVAVVSLTFSATITFAQNSVADDLELADGVLQRGASVGTLVAAALESAGYEALSIVLVDLQTTFGAIASLMFVTIVGVGLFQLVRGEKLKSIQWLLIGPPLYYFLVGANVHAAGANWQFGNYDGKQQLEVFLGDQEESNPKVPWLFHRFNVLVSSVSQELIKVLTSDTNEHLMKFRVRPEVTDQLLNAEIGSPSLNSLIRFTFYKCADGFENVSSLIGNISRDESGAVDLTKLSSSARTAYSRAQISLAEKDVALENGQWRQSLLATLLKVKDAKASGASSWDELAPYHQCLDEFVVQDGEYSEEIFSSDSVVSCGQLWCMVGVGAHYEAGTVIENAQKEMTHPDISQDTLTRIMHDIKSKLTNDQLKAETGNLTDTVASIQHIIGGHLIRKSFESTSHAMFTDRASDNWQYRASRGGKAEQVMESHQSYVREKRQEQLAEKEMVSIYVFANLLPYIQGVLLYSMAVAYPFFALFIIIPGRAQTCLMWMAGWVWVKSWDVGFAVVMLIENMLWEFLQLSSIGEYSKNFDPVETMHYAYAGNQADSLGTYYVILGMMVTSVPLLTAQVVLGSKAAIGGVLIQGIKGVADSIGSRAAARRTVAQLQGVDRSRVMGQRAYVSSAQAWIANNKGDWSSPPANIKAGIQELMSNTQFADHYQWLQSMDKLGQQLDTNPKAAEIGAYMMQLSGKGPLVDNLLKTAAAKMTLGNSPDQLSKLGIELQRTARKGMVELIDNAGKFMAHQYSLTDDFKAAEAARAGLTGSRVKVINFNDLPLDAMFGLERGREVAMQEYLVAIGKILGETHNVSDNHKGLPSK